MSIVAPVRPALAADRSDRPPHLAGLLFGVLMALPLWAVILAFLL